MPQINCQISFILSWSWTWIITNSTGAETVAITDAKLNVQVATLSTQDNKKLLKQLEWDFERRINWNK